jgi:hypothetical protein
MKPSIYREDFIFFSLKTSKTSSNTGEIEDFEWIKYRQTKNVIHATYLKNIVIYTESKPTIFAM